MKYKTEDAIEFYQLSGEARFAIAALHKSGRLYPVSGNGWMELLLFGFVEWNEDESVGLTDKGKLVTVLLGPEDRDANIHNLKLHAKSLKGRTAKNTL